MFYTVVRILVIAICCTAVGLSAMHMLQAQRYRIVELRKSLRRYKSMFTTEIVVAAGTFALDWYMPILLSMAIQKEQTRQNLCSWLMMALFIGASAFVFLQKARIPQRKPFGFTRRIARLITCTFIINLIAAILLTVMGLSPYIVFAGVDYIVLAAAFLMHPIEERINAGYYKSAQQKLAQAKGLIRVGITGSYGKTDTKIILKTILSEKYKVLATPPSFSTAMGVSRVVNDQLKPSHQVFIAEMGAQQKGEIRELTRLVKPQYGVLTCVGDAHLDSFGSIEAVAQTKFELIQGLKQGGKAFFGSDGSYGDRLYGLCKSEKYRAAIGNGVEAYMRAEHMETGVRGTRFELICADGGHAWVHARLLGSFSVRNIALAAAVAKQLGLTMEEIARGIEKLRPIRHHLQLIPGEINVIDDSENINPEGANEALLVLKEFPGRRILVTAGFEELERNADDQNFDFGMRIAACADYVILVDPDKTRAVMRGLMKAQYPKSSVRMVYDANDAEALVKDIAQKGDSVLYEGVFPVNDEEEE